MCSKVSVMLRPEIAKTRPSGHRKMLFQDVWHPAQTGISWNAVRVGMPHRGCPNIREGAYALGGCHRQGLGDKGGGSEAIAPSGARPGRVFCICRTIKFAEKVKAKYGKAQRAPMPPGLSPTGDWGIIRYSHPVLKDSAQGWLLLNDVFGISGCLLNRIQNDWT